MCRVAPRAAKVPPASYRAQPIRIRLDPISLFRSGRLGCLRNCLNDLCVPSASTEVAGKEFANLVVRGVRLPAEQVITREDHSRRADSTLRAAAIEECLLQRMQSGALSEALDRGDLRSAGLQYRYQAAVNEDTVYQHGTRSTLTLPASLFCSGERELVTQDIQESFHRVGTDGSLLAVNRQKNLAGLPRDGHLAPCGVRASPAAGAELTAVKMSSASRGIRSKRTPSASSTAFTMAGAGPSIGNSPIPLAPNAPWILPSSSK